MGYTNKYEKKKGRVKNMGETKRVCSPFEEHDNNQFITHWILGTHE